MVKDNKIYSLVIQLFIHSILGFFMRMEEEK